VDGCVSRGGEPGLVVAVGPLSEDVMMTAVLACSGWEGRLFGTKTGARCPSPVTSISLQAVGDFEQHVGMTGPAYRARAREVEAGQFAADFGSPVGPSGSERLTDRRRPDGPPASSRRP
jgi:hypothetical protein